MSSPSNRVSFSNFGKYDKEIEKSSSDVMNFYAVASGIQSSSGLMKKQNCASESMFLI